MRLMIYFEGKYQSNRLVSDEDEYDVNCIATLSLYLAILFTLSSTFMNALAEVLFIYCCQSILKWISTAEHRFL